MQAVQAGQRVLAIFIIAVYIPLQADAKLALEELYCLTSRQMNIYIEVDEMVADDFYHWNEDQLFQNTSQGPLV